MHLPANSSPHSSRWPVSGRRRPGARAAAAGSRQEPVPTPTSDCATAVAEWSAQLLRDSLCRSGRSASAWVSANSARVLHPLAARLHGPPARVRFRGRKVIRLGSVRRSGQTQYRVRGLRQPAFRPLRSDRRGEGLVSSPAGPGRYASRAAVGSDGTCSYDATATDSTSVPGSLPPAPRNARHLPGHRASTGNRVRLRTTHRGAARCRRRRRQESGVRRQPRSLQSVLPLDLFSW